MAKDAAYRKRRRKRILKRWHNKCALCGKSLNLTTMTIDHIVPVSLGGNNWKSNLRPACGECNSARGNYFVGVDGMVRGVANRPGVRGEWKLK